MFPSELLTHGSVLNVVAFRITETGTYNDQFSRPYVTDMDEGVMMRTINVVNQHIEQGGAITPTLLATANNGKPIVTPNASVEGPVDIPYGWRERRFRFILTIDVKQNIGTVSRYHYTGYSSHHDYSHGKHLDPHMPFFVNAIVRSSISKAVTPTQGAVQIERSMSSRHVIADANWQGAFASQQKYMMRPEDVFVQINSRDLMGEHDVVVDTRNMSQTNAQMSNLSNGLTHNFASSIIGAYAKQAQISPSYGNDDAVITDAMVSLRVNNSNDENPLMAAISNMRGMGMMQNNFTIEDLVKLDNNAMNQTVFAPLEAGDMGMIHQVGQSSPWTGQDGHTITAVKIAQAMPALMAVNGLQNVHLTSTNHTVEGKPYTQCTGIGFNQANLAQRVQIVSNRFDAEIIPDISAANGLGYYLEVTADHMGETRIKISVDNYPMEEFVWPSFADNLLSPVITSNQNNFALMASDFKTLLSDISVDGMATYSKSLDTNYL